MNNTLFLLMAQFNEASIEVRKCASFFGMTEIEVKKRAALNKLPIPTFPTRDSQKSPRMVHLSDLATYIDQQREVATAEWHRANTF